MGLFGSKKKTYYNTVASPLYSETPTLMKQTIIAAITQNRNIASDLVSNLANGIGYRAGMLYNYAKDGDYPWGLPDGTVTHISPQTMTYVEQTIEHELGANIILAYALVDVDPATSHIIYEAEYYLTDSKGEATGELLQWVYDESTGVYPVLDLELDDVSEVSPYFPIIPIMQDQQYLADEGQPYKLEIKRACKYLNVDPDDLHEGITSNPGYEDNPTEDAFLVLALAISDKTNTGMEYLYRFFTHQLGYSRITEVDFNYWYAKNRTVTPPINRIEIKDANYKMELGWQYIKQQVVTGTFLVPHPTNPLLPDVPSTLGAYGTAFNLNGDVAIYDVDGTELSYSDDSFIVRHQISDTQYVELHVFGLVHTNWTVGKETRTTLTKAFASSEDDVDHALIIPLRRDLLKQMGTIRTHDLTYTAIRLIINDKNVVKLKWYETGLFKAIVTIVGIVLSVLFPPAGVAVLSLAALGYALINYIVARLLMPVIFKVLEDLVGEELALIIGTLAAAYFGGGGVGAYASAGVNIASGLYGQHVQGELEDIAKELELLGDIIEERREEEAEKQEDIDLAVGISKGDSYGILQAEHHVRRFKLDMLEPTLIRETTHQFTDMLRFTDRPDSYIRLGHTGV